MSKLKKWLYERFLPAWCRDDLMRANELLSEKCKAQAREIERLQAYIDGVQAAAAPPAPDRDQLSGGI